MKKTCLCFISELCETTTKSALRGNDDSSKPTKQRARYSSIRVSRHAVYSTHLSLYFGGWTLRHETQRTIRAVTVFTEKRPLVCLQYFVLWPTKTTPGGHYFVGLFPFSSPGAISSCGAVPQPRVVSQGGRHPRPNTAVAMHQLRFHFVSPSTDNKQSPPRPPSSR